eukprot:g17492.t1
MSSPILRQFKTWFLLPTEAKVSWDMSLEMLSNSTNTEAVLTDESGGSEAIGFPTRASKIFGPTVTALCFLCAVAALVHLLKRLRQLFLHGQPTRLVYFRYCIALLLIVVEPVLFAIYLQYGMGKLTVMPIIVAQYMLIAISALLLRSLVPGGSGTSNDSLAISVLLILFHAFVHTDMWPWMTEKDFWYLFPVLWLPSPLIWGCTLAVSVAWYNAERQRQRQTPFEKRHWFVYYVCLLFLVGMDMIASYSQAWAYLISAIISVISKASFVFFWLYQERRLAQQLHLMQMPAGASLRVRVLPLRVAVIGQFIHTGSQCWRLRVDFMEYCHDYLFSFGTYTGMKFFAILGDLITSLGVIWLLATHSSKPTRSPMTEPFLFDERDGRSIEAAVRPPIVFKTPVVKGKRGDTMVVQLSQISPTTSRIETSCGHSLMSHGPVQSHTNASHGQQRAHVSTVPRSHGYVTESRSRFDRDSYATVQASPSPALSRVHASHPDELERAYQSEYNTSETADTGSGGAVEADNREGAASFAMSMSTAASWHVRADTHRPDSNGHALFLIIVDYTKSIPVCLSRQEETYEVTFTVSPVGLRWER